MLCIFLWIVFLAMAMAVYFRAEGAKAQAAEFDKEAGHSAVLKVIRISPTPTTAVTMSERDANIAIIKKIWGTHWHTGVAIAKCESGLRSAAFNAHNNDGTWDAGLFQINMIHGWSKEELLDPITNAGIAYSKFVEQGTNPWYSSEKCWKGAL